MRPILLSTGLFALLIAGGCSEKDGAPEPEPIRPVLSLIAEPQAAKSQGFAGTIESRYSANLSFRLLGRIATRPVNVGDAVKKGAVIATLDQTEMQFAVQSSQADYSSALAQFSNASTNEQRMKKLLSTNTISKAAYEAANQASLTAKANADKAKAGLDKAQEQLSYTNLSSDFDGVVTSVGADVGQTVSPGQTVVAVARADTREAVVDIPDYLIADFHTGDKFDISLQSLPSIRQQGVLREIAPQSDSATRTRRVRFALDGAPEAFRLGSTITAVQQTPAGSVIQLPLTALLEKDGATQVWTVDPTSLTVSLHKVGVARKDEVTFIVGSGLDKGARVVIAGVHSLQDGQKVKPDDGAVQ
jgi:RND family efflux transporter MFP subunit